MREGPPAAAKAALLLLGVAAVSFAAIFIRMSHAAPSVTGGYRMAIASLLLAPFAARRAVADVLSLHLRDVGLLALSSLLLSLHFLLWIASLYKTSVADSTLILALQPVIAMLGAWLLLGERPGRGAWGGAVLAIAGTAVMGFRDFLAGPEPALGDLLSLGGTVAAAGYFLAGQSLRRRMGALSYSFTVYLVAGAILLSFAALRGDRLVGLPAGDWGLFFLLALVPTLLGHTVFNLLLRWVQATTVAMGIVGEPLGAAALAFLFFHQRASPEWWIGAPLVAVGIAWHLRSAHRIRGSRSPQESTATR